MVGEKTLKIVQLNKSGISAEEIAKEYGITISSVKKRLKSYEKIQSGYYSPESTHYKKKEIPKTWSIEQLKEGFDRFIKENGRLPTAYEVDDMSYLPSARQIQRRWGGLSNLRRELGYGEVHFGKGELKAERTKLTGKRGGDAEDKLNNLLVTRFGELFVHSEKRFGLARNRVDFVVYAENATIGIDVFATDEKRAIIKNIAIKIPKYTDFPSNIPLYFVVWSEIPSQDDISDAVKNMSALKSLKGLRVVGVEQLFVDLDGLEPLSSPVGFNAFKNSEEGVIA